MFSDAEDEPNPIYILYIYSDRHIDVYIIYIYIVTDR